MRSKRFWRIFAGILVFTTLIALKCYAYWETYVGSDGTMYQIWHDPITGSITLIAGGSAAFGGGYLIYRLFRTF